jgi:hypothetical protein
MIKLGANEAATFAAFAKAFKVLKSPVVLDLADADGATYIRMRAAGPGVALLAALIPLKGDAAVGEKTRRAVRSESLASVFEQFTRGDTLGLEVATSGLNIFRCAKGQAISRINIPETGVPSTYANTEPLTRAVADGAADRLIPTLLDVGAVTAWRTAVASDWGDLSERVRISRDAGGLVMDCTNAAVIYSGRIPCDFNEGTPDDFRAYVNRDCIQILKKLTPIWGPSGPAFISAGADGGAVLVSALTNSVLVGTNSSMEYPDVENTLKDYRTNSKAFLTCNRNSFLEVLKILNRGGALDKKVVLTLDGEGRMDLKTYDGQISFDGVQAEGGPGVAVVELRCLLDAVGRMAGTDLRIGATDRILGMSNRGLTTLIGRCGWLEEEHDKEEA